MDELNEYEKAQVRAIEDWKKEEPGVVSQAFGIIVEPLAWLVQKVVPESAIAGALDFASTAGQWLTDTGDILHKAEAKKVSELRTKDLQLSDRLADDVHNWAIGIAVAEGAATGAFGLFGAPVDIPAIITIAMRTIHKIGVCYGYECESEHDRNFVRGILAASGANSMEEKLGALATLQALKVIVARQTWKGMGRECKVPLQKPVKVIVARQTWKGMAEKAAQSQLSKEAALVGLRNLAKQLGVNITKRRALAAIPAIGALVGGSVNGWYIKDVGWAARRSFQERWLAENGKFIEISS